MSASAHEKPRRARGLLTRKPGPLPYAFLATLFILQVFGLVMLFSASYTTGYLRFGDSYSFIKSQFAYAVLGFGAMLVISRVNYHWLRGWAKIGYGTCIFLLLVVQLTCDPINGCKRWLYWDVPGLRSLPTIQVSEIVKFVMILLTADTMCRFRAQRKTLRDGVIRPILPLIPIVVLLFFEPHFSGMILICAIVGSMMLLGGNGGFWMPLGMAGGGAGLYLILHFSQGIVTYLAKRLDGWTSDLSQMTYQTRQSLYAIGSGGLLGLGLGNSMEKQLWLPECTNDFIFSVVCEELGFVGAMVVIALFVALIVQGIYIAYEAADLFGTLVALGITAQIAWQVFCNIGVVTNTLPNTGISLPFFSSGGTSLLMLLGEMGVLLSVARAGAKAKAEEAARDEAENAPMAPRAAGAAAIR